MDKIQFKLWLEKFKTRNQGWFPENESKWLDKVDDSHLEIRKLIGGELVQKFYKITSAQNPLPDVLAQEYYQKFLNITDIFQESELSDYKSIAVPSVPKGTHGVIKTSKIISGYINNYYNAKLITGTQRLQLEKLNLELCEQWNRYKTSESEIEITLSTTPKAFALLGHYGPDEDSCFRQNSSSPYDKYILGQSKDTFVITISKKRDNKYTNVARCIGFMALNGQIFNLANYYFDNKFSEGDGLESIKKLFEDITDIKFNIVENFTGFRGSTEEWPKFFINKYGNWSFIDINLVPSEHSEKCVINLNLGGILLHECQKCNQGDKKLYDIDEIRVCKLCYIRANVCKRTNLRTFQPLVEIYSTDGQQLFVHHSYAASIDYCMSCFNKCEDMIQSNNMLICENCYESEIFTCDICNKEFFTEEIENIDGEEYCNNCIKDNILVIDEQNIPIIINEHEPKNALD